jgi:HAD superfamily hydrolase (TIGR01490 family)
LSRRIAFFDFDGTITDRDTLLEIFKYKHGNFKFWFGFLLHTPVLVAYRLKIVSNQSAKEQMLRFFFGNMPIAQFRAQCVAFSKNKLSHLTRPKALDEIKKLQEAGTEVVIVSASAQDWIKDWCLEIGVSLIATHLEVKDSKVTGKIEGRNCHGEEKVRRIQAAYNLTEYNEIYCYGDSKGDKPMLALGTISFYKPFR